MVEIHGVARITNFSVQGSTGNLRLDANDGALSFTNRALTIDLGDGNQVCHIGVLQLEQGDLNLS